MHTTIRLTLVTSLALIALIALGAQAQGPSTPGGRGARLYDPKTVLTLSGKVTAVDRTGPMGLGLHLRLETSSGTMPIHVGPMWFLQTKGIDLAVGDVIEVTGSRITFDGEPAVIAQTVKKADQVLVLRDVQGFPVWAGRGGPRRP